MSVINAIIFYSKLNILGLSNWIITLWLQINHQPNLSCLICGARSRQHSSVTASWSLWPVKDVFYCDIKSSVLFFFLTHWGTIILLSISFCFPTSILLGSSCCGIKCHSYKLVALHSSLEQLKRGHFDCHPPPSTPPPGVGWLKTLRF